MKYLILFFLSYLCVNCDAQTNHWEVETGISLNTTFGTPTINNTTKEALLGFNSGLRRNALIFKNFGINTGLLYEQKGYEIVIDQIYIQGSITSSSIRTSMRYNYLSIPIIANYALQLSSKIFILPGIGGYNAFLLSQKSIFQDITTEGQPKYKTSLEKQKMDKRYDWGLTGELALHYNLSNSIGIKILTRYNYGMFDISKQPLINNGERRHESLLILLGINMILKNM